MLLLGDCNDHLKDIRDNSIDLIITDPPYGIEFMGKDWDKALVPTETWKECFRVLKEGKLAFVMCSPRQDVLSRMIINLQDAGFRTNYTSIYWTFASGFPKAANISKLIDKKNGRTQETFKPFGQYLKEKRTAKNLSMREIDERLGTNTAYSWWEGRAAGVQLPTKHYYLQLKSMLELDDRFDDLIEREEAEREIIGKNPSSRPNPNHNDLFGIKPPNDYFFTKPATEEAKKMEGAYVGFQPKPAVEVILVVSKGKTLTWLDDCRIPYNKETDEQPRIRDGKTCDRSADKNKVYSGSYGALESPYFHEKERFPANLLVSSNVLDNGENYSRYFSLDSWDRYTLSIDTRNIDTYSVYQKNKTFPFIITPKASRSERNKGLDSLEPIKVNDGRNTPIDNPFQRGETLRTNSHPTVKPLKLMSYLITMGSREGDLVLDPFCGSGTVCIAAHQLHRKWLGIEMNPEYAEIIKKRLADPLAQLKLSAFD